MDEEILRRQADARIREGKLPTRTPSLTRGGPGTGHLCDLCDRSITEDEVEIELVLPPDPRLVTLRFHSSCHVAWDLERIRAD